MSIMMAVSTDLIEFKVKVQYILKLLVLKISFLLAMNTEILKNRIKDLMLSDGDVTTFE